MPLGIMMKTDPAAPVDEDGPLSKRRVVGVPDASAGHLRQVTSSAALTTRQKQQLVPDSVSLGMGLDDNLKRTVEHMWWFQAILNLKRDLEGHDGDGETKDSPPASGFERAFGSWQVEKNATLFIRYFPLTTIPAAMVFMTKLPETLLSVELRGCGLQAKDVAEALFFSDCFQIRSLCLANNRLQSIPIFLDKLKNLQILDLSDNLLRHNLKNIEEDDPTVDSHVVTATGSTVVSDLPGMSTGTYINSGVGTGIGASSRTIDDESSALKWDNQTTIVAALQQQEYRRVGDDITRSLDLIALNQNLAYLNLQGNTQLCSQIDYRDMVCTSLPFLLALDMHLICDEERLDSMPALKQKLGISSHDFFNFRAPYCAGNPIYRIPEFFYQGVREVRPVELNLESREGGNRSRIQSTGDHKQANTELSLPIVAEENEGSPSLGGSVADGVNKNSCLMNLSLASSTLSEQVPAPFMTRKHTIGALYHSGHDIDSMISALRIQYCKTSPVVLIQRTYRAWRAWKSILGNSIRREMVTIQANIRRWLLKQRCRREWKRLLVEAGEWQEELTAEEKAEIEERRKKAILLRRTQHLSHFVLILTKFLRYSVKVGTRWRAATMINNWTRKFINGWRSDMQWLSNHHVSDLVVCHEDSEDTAELFNFYFERAQRKGIIAKQVLTPELSYKTVSLNRIRLHDQRGIKMRRNKYLTRGPFFATKGALTLPQRILPRLFGFWRLFSSRTVAAENRRAVRLIKSRGSGLINISAIKFKLHTSAKAQGFHQKGQALCVITLKSIITSSSALLKKDVSQPSDSLLYVLLCVVRHIHSFRKYDYVKTSDIAMKHFQQKRMTKCTQCWYLHDILPSSAATTIQANWRGVYKRQKGSSQFFMRLLKRRAAVALQRWWRMRNGLHRRFRMLQHIHDICHHIDTPTIYMDMWSFYKCLKQPTLPRLPSTLHLFPEFRCTPYIALNGSCVLKPLEYDAHEAAHWEDTVETVIVPSALSGGLSRMKTITESNVEDDNASASIKVRINSSVKADKTVKGRPRGSLWNPAVKLRNINKQTGARFGLPLWATFRPDSESFFANKNNWASSNKSFFDKEYAYARSRYSPRDSVTHELLPGGGEFLLFDLVTKFVNVRSRSINLKHRQQGCIVDANTEIDTDIRVVSLSCRTVREAQNRAALIMLSTYDAASHTSVIPMTESTLCSKLAEKKRDIFTHNLNLIQDTEEAEEHMSETPHNTTHENKGGIDAIVAPVESRVFLQDSPPSWVESKDSDMWDIARFRFMVNSMIVCSTQEYMVDLENKPEGKTRRKGPRVPTEEELTREAGREMSNGEKDEMIANLIKQRRGLHKRHDKMRMIDRGLLTYSMMSEYSSLPAFNSRVWDTSTDTEDTSTCETREEATSMMESVLNSMDESEVQLSLGDKQETHEVLEVAERGAWGQMLYVKKAAKINDSAIPVTSVNYSEKAVTRDGPDLPHDDTPRSQESGLTSSVANGASIDPNASDDGFESIYSSNTLNEKQILLRRTLPLDESDQAKQIDKPRVPLLYTIRRAVSNSSLANTIKTTATMAFLRSNVWDTHRMLLWVSRGVEVALETAAPSVSDRQLSNERKALVGRLEALQLGLYEHSIRMTRRIAHENALASKVVAPINDERMIRSKYLELLGFDKTAVFGPFSATGDVSGTHSRGVKVLSPRARANSPPYNTSHGNTSMIDSSMRVSSPPQSRQLGTPRSLEQNQGIPPRSHALDLKVRTIEGKKKAIQEELAKKRLEQDKEKRIEDVRKSREAKKMTQLAKKISKERSGQVAAHVAKTQQNTQQTAKKFQDEIRKQNIEQTKQRLKRLPRINNEIHPTLKDAEPEVDNCTPGVPIPIGSLGLAAAAHDLKNRQFLQDVRRTSSQQKRKSSPDPRDEIARGVAGVADVGTKTEIALDLMALDLNSSEAPGMPIDFENITYGISLDDSDIGDSHFDGVECLTSVVRQEGHNLTNVVSGTPVDCAPMICSEAVSASGLSNSRCSSSGDVNLSSSGRMGSRSNSRILNTGASHAGGSVASDLADMIAASAVEFPGSIVRSTKSHSSMPYDDVQSGSSNAFHEKLRIHGSQSENQSCAISASVYSSYLNDTVDLSSIFEGSSQGVIVPHIEAGRRTETTIGNTTIESEGLFQQDALVAAAPAIARNKEVPQKPKSQTIKYRGFVSKSSHAEKQQNAMQAKKQKVPYRDLLVRPPSSGYVPVYVMDGETGGPDLTQIFKATKPSRPKPGKSTMHVAPTSPRRMRDGDLLASSPVEVMNSTVTPMEPVAPDVMRPPPPWMNYRGENENMLPPLKPRSR